MIFCTQFCDTDLPRYRVVAWWASNVHTRTVHARHGSAAADLVANSLGRVIDDLHEVDVVPVDGCPVEVA